MAFNHKIDFHTTVNGIVYRSVREEDFDSVLDFFYDVFLKDEPATISYGGYSLRNERLDKDMRDVLKDGVSIIAEDPANGNRMVGFRTAFTIERGNKAEKVSYEENLKIYPPCHAAILHLFDLLLFPDDIFAKFPELNKIYDMFTLASHPDYRGRGIATELIQQCKKVAELAGCDALIVLSTNDLSRKIFEKTGFETMSIHSWNEFAVNGKQLFENVQSNNAVTHIFRLKGNGNPEKK